MNRLAGFASFLERWRRDAPAELDAPLVRQSPLGNRNMLGSPSNTEAYSFVRGQDGFEASIEPGIRSLVMFLVDDVQVVTYSSCQGHAASPESPFRAAHVGLLSRPYGASWRVGAGHDVGCVLDQAARHVMLHLPDPVAGVRVVQDQLETDAGPEPCLDIWFLPIRGSEDDYFRCLPHLVNAFHEELARTLQRPVVAETKSC